MDKAAALSEINGWEDWFQVLVGPHKGVVLKKLTGILSTYTKFLIMCSCNCLVADLSLHPWREKI